MPQSKLELIAIAQRNTLIPMNTYNVDSTQNYKATHTRALSDDLTPENGKGTGQLLDTANGGSSTDIYGAAGISGSGRLASIATNQYNANNGYTAPDTSGNVGQVVID